MDVTFKINGTDYSRKLSTYHVYKEISTKYLLTTLNDEEIPGPASFRYIVEVSFWPMTDAESAAFFNDLNGIIAEIDFTDPDRNKDITKKMRLTTDIEKTFGLRSIDGNRYYKGGVLQFRGVMPFACNE